MNRIERIEATLAEADAVDREFPLAKPALARISVHREDLRALLRLAKAACADNDSVGDMVEYGQAIAALEAPCDNS